MTDSQIRLQRSFNMSMIHGKNTKPEIMVRHFLFGNGFRYRVNVKDLPGKPDILLPKYRTAIFVNGCFWHGHYNCKYFVIPKTRTEWWSKKIQRTINRDNETHQQLLQLGWSVITIWECQLKSKTRLNTLHDLVDLLYKNYLDIYRTK
jgi:DNA mismatch endonuclease, patch repair protein